MDNATDRSSVIASSLATILSKSFNARSSNNSHLIDKCALFVAKLESKRSTTAKAFFGGMGVAGAVGAGGGGSSKAKVRNIQGHNFELRQYYQTTMCNLSGEIIWGVGPQGYRCSCKVYLDGTVF